MPIAICYTNDKKIDTTLLQRLITEWATLINVDTKDIHLSVVSPLMQSGQHYKLFAQIFLPTLWTREEVNTIQLNFLRLLMKHVGFSASEIFIITTLVPSGQVVENGSVIEWTNSTEPKNNLSIL